jgi:hypothetical protein
MASGKPISNTPVMVEPKAKRKYKTKNEEDTTLKEFVTLGKILVEDDLPKEEVQNLKVTWVLLLINKMMIF